MKLFYRHSRFVCDLKKKCGHLDLLLRRIEKLVIILATFYYRFNSQEFQAENSEFPTFLMIIDTVDVSVIAFFSLEYILRYINISLKNKKKRKSSGLKIITKTLVYKIFFHDI